jgi:hypothetical protein
MADVIDADGAKAVPPDQLDGGLEQAIFGVTDATHIRE